MSMTVYKKSTCDDISNLWTRIIFAVLFVSNSQFYLPVHIKRLHTLVKSRSGDVAFPDKSILSSNFTCQLCYPFLDIDWLPPLKLSSCGCGKANAPGFWKWVHNTRPLHVLEIIFLFCNKAISTSEFGIVSLDQRFALQWNQIQIVMVLIHLSVPWNLEHILLWCPWM